MMKQYFSIKDKYKDCILFYRMGDFYEMFYDDARIASEILDITLTSRGKNKMGSIPLCGFPYHAVDNYTGKLINAGYKVAICEQTEDPASAKGIVKRDVIRIITAGTWIDDSDQQTRYTMAIAPYPDKTGIAFIDSTGGTIFCAHYKDKEELAAAISKLPVYDCVYPASCDDEIKCIFSLPLLKIKTMTMSPHEDWGFEISHSYRTLCEHFKTHSLEGFGINSKDQSIISAAGGLLDYMRKVNKTTMQHVDKLSIYDDKDFTYISPAACYGLELENLFKVINRTKTASGKRCLRNWLYHPLKDVIKIRSRQQMISLFNDNRQIRDDLINSFKNITDIERCVTRISCASSTPRDLVALRNTLTKLPEIINIIGPLNTDNEYCCINDIKELRELLEKSLNSEIPSANYDGKVVAQGYDSELDSYRDIQKNAKKWLQDFQEAEKKRSGIASLKIGFNKVFGYYIEITRANQHLVPETYIRKQTLVNAERYITPELKEFEEKMLSADDKVKSIEKTVTAEIENHVLKTSKLLHDCSQSLAQLDSLAALAVLADNNNYVCPAVDNSFRIFIKDGRHPVVEANITNEFIPNDTVLDDNENQLIILTGPNMSGKSTYIRQCALLVIMAQMGSHIPARKARIGVVDKVFTRIGAHDELSRGQSTFMVEMNETADILNNMTPASLLILDEIGRGTSTYDGLSLAWSIAEYIAEKKARTLFATHFHELTALADESPGIKNYNVAVKEWGDDVIFMHKIMPGSTDDSYGIYVAKIAGIPSAVLKRSRDILSRLEQHGALHEKILNDESDDDSVEKQLSFFDGVRR